MRHRRDVTKLGRSPEHRSAMLAALVCGLIDHRRVSTTLAKAKMGRGLAEKMVTVAKAGSLAARRHAVSVLRNKASVKTLFDVIAPKCASRNGGYTRIVKRGRRASDSSEMAFLEWVDVTPIVREKKPKKTDTKAKT